MMRLKVVRQPHVVTCTLKPFEWGLNSAHPKAEDAARELNANLVKLVNTGHHWKDTMQRLFEVIMDLGFLHPGVIRHEGLWQGKIQHLVHFVYVEPWKTEVQVTESSEEWRRQAIEEAASERGV